ncbi:MAG: hypothetical protein K8R58_15225 [Bacteroidales bacterium]|nr:hypothetical protein [Bacteroidales bacterium]
MKIKDFTFQAYKLLLEEGLGRGYEITSYENYINSKTTDDKVIIMRHDVDRKPWNGVKMARIEKDLRVIASYYFRVVNESYDEQAIKEIIGLGHEFAYHYEDLALANGNYEKAIENFGKNLEKLRQFYPIVTMCMHGSPKTKWNNNMIWDKYNFHDYEIVADPHFDIDFSKVFYITDASRAWNKESVTVRDKPISEMKIEVKTIFDIIDKIRSDKMPTQIMLNIHPHNWAESDLCWLKTKYYQSLKNIIKRVLIKVCS